MMITEIDGKAVITFDCDNKLDVLELREKLCLLMWKITDSDHSDINELGSLAKIIYMMGDDAK